MSTISSVSKWKMSTYILALTTAAALYQGRGSGAAGDPQKVKPAERDSSFDRRMSGLARLRIPASMAGVDEKQLLRDLRATGSVPRMILICERLAIFGSDRALESLLRVSKDHPRAAAAAIAAMGGIGSDKATDQLFEMMERGLSYEQGHIIRALATTRNSRAKSKVMEWAHKGDRGRRLTAIVELGTIGGPEAIELLQALAESEDQGVVRSVLQAAGAIGSEDTVAILQRVSEGDNRRLRRDALHQLPSSLNEEQEAWLIDMFAHPDSQTSASAADALGRARVSDALPLLLDAARSGVPEVQLASIRALAKLGGESAQEAITELFAEANQRNAYELGTALIQSGAEGRATFLASMKVGKQVRPRLLHLLEGLVGEDVDEVRMHIVHSGQPKEKLAVLQQMDTSENEEALEIVLVMARGGSQQVRSGSMRLLAKSSSPRAQTALREIARGSGPASVEALQILGNSALASGEGTSVLMDALFSKNPRKVQAASWALASEGSEDGRAALLAAMQSDDLRLARAATQAAGQLGGSADVSESLQELARNSKDPQLKAAALQQLVSSGSPAATELVVEALRKGESSADYLISSVLNGGQVDSDIVIAEAAKSEKAHTRAALAGALSQRGGDKESMRLLVELSEDEDDTVKNAAVYALSNVGSSESVDRLLELAAHGDSSTRGVALSLIGNTGDPRATSVIAEAISSDDAGLVQHALHGAANAGPEVESALVGLVENGDAALHLRRHAANTLVARGVDVDKETLETLNISTEQSTGGYDDYFPY